MSKRESLYDDIPWHQLNSIGSWLPVTYFLFKYCDFILEHCYLSSNGDFINKSQGTKLKFQLFQSHHLELLQESCNFKLL